jgi:hypothetical protein
MQAILGRKADPTRYLHRPTNPWFYGYSVVKHQNKRSGCDWFPHETGATAPENNNSLVLLPFRGRERRSRIIKYLIQSAGRSIDPADKSRILRTYTRGHSATGRAASIGWSECRRMFSVYVTRFESL